MADYLSSSVLGLALTDTNPAQTLYFQDTALFPAFLFLTQLERAELPNDIALTPLYAVQKRAMRLVLPGANFLSSPFVPLDIQLSSVAMCPWVRGFNDSSAILLGGVSYTLFDDIASDLFIIAPSSTPLASLNARYTGSHRIAPILVLKTLKRVAELLGNVTLSNTETIPDPGGIAVIIPPVVIIPPPIVPIITFPSTDTASRMTLDGVVWSLSRGMSGTEPVTQILRSVASNLSISTVNSDIARIRLQDGLNAKISGRTHILSNPRIEAFMDSNLLWTVTS